MDIHVSPQIERLIRDALDEDIGAGDLATMATISADARGKGLFRAKKDGVVDGLVLLDRIFYFIDHRVDVRLLVNDGAAVNSGMVVAEAAGPVRALLLGERTALNFLQQLSGTATLTRKLVDAVKDFSCKVLDTRKTTPGLRTLQKYAVRMGGGTNHRIGLYDAALVKDNHIEA
ncbi:MAG TPA: nicotinate-nucleotide diphosphorylase (carboxylating), partial [Candidatus Binatia bacterium]|nr:nicotinate-nucleotide diphosphorylase (carboxylating) [Candidatus Binatia bacterium]